MEIKSKFNIDDEIYYCDPSTLIPRKYKIFSIGIDKNDNNTEITYCCLQGNLDTFTGKFNYTIRNIYINENDLLSTESEVIDYISKKVNYYLSTQRDMTENEFIQKEKLFAEMKQEAGILLKPAIPSY